MTVKVLILVIGILCATVGLLLHSTPVTLVSCGLCALFLKLSICIGSIVRQAKFALAVNGILVSYDDKRTCCTGKNVRFEPLPHTRSWYISNALCRALPDALVNVVQRYCAKPDRLHILRDEFGDYFKEELWFHVSECKDTRPWRHVAPVWRQWPFKRVLDIIADVPPCESRAIIMPCIGSTNTNSRNGDGVDNDSHDNDNSIDKNNNTNAVLIEVPHDFIDVECGDDEVQNTDKIDSGGDGNDDDDAYADAKSYKNGFHSHNSDANCIDFDGDCNKAIRQTPPLTHSKFFHSNLCSPFDCQCEQQHQPTTLIQIPGNLLTCETLARLIRNIHALDNIYNFRCTPSSLTATSLLAAQSVYHDQKTPNVSSSFHDSQQRTCFFASDNNNDDVGVCCERQKLQQRQQLQQQTASHDVPIVACLRKILHQLDNNQRQTIGDGNCPHCRSLSLCAGLRQRCVAYVAYCKQTLFKKFNAMQCRENGCVHSWHSFEQTRVQVDTHSTIIGSLFPSLCSKYCSMTSSDVGIMAKGSRGIVNRANKTVFVRLAPTYWNAFDNGIHAATHFHLVSD